MESANKKPMTKERLKQYRAIRIEIRGREKKLGCSGTAPGEHGREWEKNRERLELLKRECQEIEGFVDRIEESRARQIFEMKFYEGKTQYEIGKKLYIDQSVVSRVIDSYLKDA